VRLVLRLLAAALPAVLLGPASAPAGAADDLPKFGVISRPKGFSTIRLTAAPGLSVFLDGEPAGTTDVLRQGLWIEDLPAGTYTLRVEKPGFESRVVRVTVAEGDTKEVRVLGLRPMPTPTPAPTPTPLPPGWKPLPVATSAPPAPTPVPVRTVIFERKVVPGGTLVIGAASSPADVLPLLETLKAECGCAPALQEMTRRKDGLYAFTVKLPEG
jgi:hypothetical protein